jgi:UDP-N-acetylglucosamine 2-epimerase (non-hydrolysing)
MSAESQMKVLSVVGARPNFMKVAPIIRAIGEHNARNEKPRIEHILVHTGQHYDALMSGQFFTDLNLSSPDVHLGVGSGSQIAQTAEILQKFEAVISRERPDVVLVVGDVTSTLACALATSKLPELPNKRRALIAHVEAGLRSFDRSMPEEINRILTDHLSDLLFVTEKSGLENLRRESISSEKVFFVGNTMIDSLLTFRDRAEASPILEQLGLRAASSPSDGAGSSQPYALLTLHRPSNVDEGPAFRNILEGLSELGRELPIIFPVHPRTRKRIEEFGVGRYFQNAATENQKGIRMIDPLGYIDFLCAMKNARLVLTDSGGIQEETTCLGVPCVTIRENTERPVTVEHGTNVISGTSMEGIRKAIARQMLAKAHAGTPEKWDGKTAERIVAVLAACSFQANPSPVLAGER